MLSLRLIARLALAAAAVTAVSVQGFCQSGGSSPVYHLREDRNEVSLYERFSTFIEHSARIKRVMDFDEEVITIQTVEGNPNQFRVYALRAGVTSITIVDENDVSYSVDVFVRGDVRHLESFIRRLYPNDSITVEEVQDDSVRLDGWVSKPEYVGEIQQIAEQFYPTVLNHMKTGGVQQVLLKCQILEVQRSKLRRLGMNFALIKPDGYLISTPGPITPLSGLTVPGGGSATPTFTGLSGTSINFGLTRPDGRFQSFIQAMIEENILKSNATPMIVTHNGRPANFLSGGEVPVPVSAGLGAVGVEYREFGIQMNAVPYILGNGRVRMEVEAIIRDRDFSNTVVVNGSATPGFRTNSANTQVEMNFGEALVIAGLVSHRENGTGSKVPFVGELPWIGTAFSRKSYEESEVELIILITPDLVAPMAPGQVPSQGPGQFTDMPVDRELFAHGLFEVPKFGDECQFCTECMGSGAPCSKCQNCRPGGAGGSGSSGGVNCVPSQAAKQSQPSGASPLIAPVSKSQTLPAEAPASSDSTSPRTSPPRARKAGSARSSGSGLISPTMR